MMAQVNSIAPIDIIAIILSIVSLIITVVGFFASLKFYRDGVELQAKANEALTKLEEKLGFIQTQVGDMFGKTLDAAIGKREVLSANFEELTGQLETAKNKIIEESIKQIGTVSEQEHKRLSELVDKQIDLIREKVESTRESAEEISQVIYRSMTVRQYLLLSKLNENEEGFTVEQLVEKMNQPIENIKRLLSELMGRGCIGLGRSKYHILSRGKEVLSLGR